MKFNHSTIYQAFLLSAFMCVNVSADVKIVCSSALLSDRYDLRKSEYIKCMEILAGYGYPDPYIIEAVAEKGPTFLDDYSTHVFYSQVNDASLRNKGVNEGRSMIEGLKHFNFSPDDMIIKISGRYHFFSDYFIRVVENNPDVDVFAKTSDHLGMHFHCFAIRAKYLLDMLQGIDYEKLIRDHIPLEWEIRKYVTSLGSKKNIKIMYVDKFDMTGLVWGTAGYQPGIGTW